MIRQFGYVTKADVDNEVRALKKLCQNQHPNIVQVFDYGQINTDGTIHFIDMELCDISLGNYLLGQELKDVISWTTVREQEEIPTHAYNILQQILNGLLFIHCLDEVHRDLSPQNGISSLFLPLIASIVQQRILEDCRFWPHLERHVEKAHHEQCCSWKRMLSSARTAPRFRIGLQQQVGHVVIWMHRI